MKEFEATDVTLMVIDEKKIIEDPNGQTIMPPPYKLIDVQLNNRWMFNAIEAQRNCEMQGESFVIRLLQDDEPLKPPIFAICILSLPCQFTAFVTGGRN